MQLQSFFPQDDAGNLLTGGTATVYLKGTQTLATGLEDAAGNPVANPVAAAESGRIQFRAPMGDYDVLLEAGGFSLQVEASFVEAGDLIELSEAVQKPIQTGMLNGWPDPFFRNLNIGESMMGRERWRHPGDLTFVDNLLFTGRAARKTDTASNFAGLRVWIDEFGVEVGDTVTLRMVITNTASARIGYSQYRLGSNTALDSSSISTFTASATPTVRTISFTVAAQCQYIDLYWFVQTGTGNVDCHAAWVCKGSAADTPAWPTIEQDVIPYLDYQIRDLPNTKAATDYAITSYGGVSSDAETVSLAVAEVSLDTDYGATFTGWGETYTPAGVSFNAVRVKSLGRKSDVVVANFWRTLKVVVRTGATPSGVTGTVVAVGTSIVDPNAMPLEDVTVILRDPTTGDVKTLTDADFTDGKYFIGVMVLNDTGGAAYCSPHIATQSNTLGQSYYTTNALAENNSYFNAWGTNRRVGVEHLLLENPVDTTIYQPSEQLREDLAGGAADVSAPMDSGQLPNYLAKRAKGEQVVVGWIGDSWTNDERRGLTQFRQHLADEIGVSGAGYVSANTDNVRTPPQVSRARTGTWTDVRVSGGQGPDAAHAVATADGATLTITPSQTVSTYTIHYLQQPDGGTFTYQIGSGSSTVVDTDGAETYTTIAVAGAEALTITVTAAGAAGVTLMGVDCRNEIAGEAVVHKLGNSGGTAARILGVNQTYAEAAYAALGFDVAIIAFTTNEQSAGTSPETLAENVAALAGRILAARPLCDIIVFAPGPNALSSAYPTSDYTDALYSLAVSNGWAFFNTTPVFGSYAGANSRGLYSDTVHPNEDGGSVIGGALYRAHFSQA